MGVRLYHDSTAAKAPGSRRPAAVVSAPDVPLDRRSHAELYAALQFVASVLPPATLAAFLQHGPAQEDTDAPRPPVSGLQDYVGLYVGVRMDALAAGVAQQVCARRRSGIGCAQDCLVVAVSCDCTGCDMR